MKGIYCNQTICDYFYYQENSLEQRIWNETNFLFTLTKINSFRSITFVKKKEKKKLS